MTTRHPQYGLMCEICCAGLTPARCAVDTNGDAWDVCAGECARQAGIVERRPARPTLVDRVAFHFDAYWWAWLAALAMMALYVMLVSIGYLVSAS